MHDLVQQILQRQVERVHALLGGVRVLAGRLQTRLLQPVDLLQRQHVQTGQRAQLTDPRPVLKTPPAREIAPACIDGDK